MKQFLVILFVSVLSIILSSLYSKQTLALWSQAFDTACNSFIRSDPCSYHYFSDTCSASGDWADLLCQVNPWCNHRTGNDCKDDERHWSGPYDYCINVVQPHLPDGTLVTSPDYTCTDGDGTPVGGYPLFQFYKPSDCKRAGGICIPSYPCNQDYDSSTLSCDGDKGDGSACCVVASTPTLTPTPTGTCYSNPPDGVCMASTPCNAPYGRTSLYGTGSPYCTNPSFTYCCVVPTLTPTPTLSPTLTPTPTTPPSGCNNPPSACGTGCCSTYICCATLSYTCRTTANCPTPTSGPSATPTLTPAITLTPTPVLYSVGGKMFNDVNGDTYSTGDSLYSGAVTIAVVNNTTSTSYAVNNSGGIYTTDIAGVKKLPSGPYTVTFSALPANYSFTYPPPNPGNSLIVNVGPSCSVPNPGNGEASCSSNNVINLTAGVRNNTTSGNAWYQSIGSDMRWDKPGGFQLTSGKSLTIPSGKYASVPLLTGGMPGIIFSGATGFAQPLQASERKSNQFNWQVGSFSNPDVFTDSHLIQTSYRFLLETAQGSAIPITNITSPAGINIYGMYKADNGLTVDTPIEFGRGNFSTGNFIILVHGDLNIESNITVPIPINSTVVFSVSGNIIVDPNVTEIQGLYSADGNFIVNSIANCPATPDTAKLNVSGTVIANAGRLGGTFQNNRTFCAGNSVNPSVTFTERPDFILNYPSMAGQINRIWQDVAP